MVQCGTLYGVLYMHKSAPKRCLCVHAVSPGVPALVCQPWCTSPGVSGLVCQPWCTSPGVPALVCQPWCVSPGMPALVYQSWCVSPGVPALVCQPWCTSPGVPVLVCQPWCASPGMPAPWCTSPDVYSLPAVEICDRKCWSSSSDLAKGWLGGVTTCICPYMYIYISFYPPYK